MAKMKDIYQEALSLLNLDNYQDADRLFRQLKGLSSNEGNKECLGIATVFSALAESAKRLTLKYNLEVLKDGKSLEQFKKEYLSTLEISKDAAEAKLSGHRLDDFNTAYNAIYKKMFK